MNEELANTANIALKGIIDSVTATKDFVLAELPEVVEQLLIWKMAESLVWCVVGVLALLAIAVNASKLIAYGKNVGWQDYTRNEEGDRQATNLKPWLYFTIIGTAIAAPIACLTVNIAWLQIWIAPKVYLLEYASELVK